MKPTDIVYNPWASIDPRYSSSVSFCWAGNQLSGCDNFTPNTKLDSYPAGVFHGNHGPGVRFIPTVSSLQKKKHPPIVNDLSHLVVDPIRLRPVKPIKGWGLGSSLGAHNLPNNR